MAPIALEPYEENDYNNHKVTATSDTATTLTGGVPFGFGEDAWLYFPQTDRFDLSRGSSKKLVIDADHGVRNHRVGGTTGPLTGKELRPTPVSHDSVTDRSHQGVMIDPDKTVLVVIDMQNYFIHPKCRDHAGGIAAVKPTLDVVERCRKEGIQIAWLNWGINEHDLKVMPPAVQRGFCHNRMKTMGYGWHVGLGAELPDDQGKCLWKGSWNARLYDPFLEASRRNDLYFDKNRPSGMWSRDEPLHKYMLESKKKTMLFCGVNTDQCVLGTITDSYSSGFDCIMLGDCVGTMTGFAAKELVEYNVATNYGFVTDSEAFLNAHHI